MNLAAGTLLQQGKYTIEAVLAEGYLHTTYRAFDATSGQIVVLKTLSDRLMAKASHTQLSLLSQGFKNKAKKLFDCQHQHLVKVFDFFTENHPDNSQDFVVTEYIAGPNLGELLKYGHTLTPSQAIHYISQAAIALSALHNKGLLHDQVCPQNIIRQAGTNQIILTDINLIDHLFLSNNKIAVKPKLTGYSASELYDDHLPIANATDIYSLSASLYSLLSSEIPISVPLRTKKSLTDLHLFHPHLPETITSTILQGMALQPTERPESVIVWLQQLTKPKCLTREKSLDNTNLHSYSMSISSVSDLPKVEKQLENQSEKSSVATMLSDSENIKSPAVEVMNRPIAPPESSVFEQSQTRENMEENHNTFNILLRKQILWKNLIAQSPILPDYVIHTLTFLLFLGTSLFSTWLGFTTTLNWQGDRQLKSQLTSPPANSMLRPQDQSTPIFDNLSTDQNNQPSFPVRVKNSTVRNIPDENLESLPEREVTTEQLPVDDVTPAINREQFSDTVLDNPTQENSPVATPSELPSTNDYDDYTGTTINNDSSIPVESPLPTENTLENTVSSDEQGNSEINPTPLETTIDPINSVNTDQISSDQINTDQSNTPISNQLENLPLATPTVEPVDLGNSGETTQNHDSQSNVNDLPGNLPGNLPTNPATNDILPTEEQIQPVDKS